jgi:hypothetical protein
MAKSSVSTARFGWHRGSTTVMLATRASPRRSRVSHPIARARCGWVGPAKVVVAESNADWTSFRRRPANTRRFALSRSTIKVLRQAGAMSHALRFLADGGALSGPKGGPSVSAGEDPAHQGRRLLCPRGFRGSGLPALRQVDTSPSLIASPSIPARSGRLASHALSAAASQADGHADAAS